MHTPKKKKKKEKMKKKTVYKIFFISIVTKGLSRGFHLINAKRQLNNACFVPKLGKEKGGNQHVAEFLEKGQFVFRTEY